MKENKKRLMKIANLAIAMVIGNTDVHSSRSFLYV